MADLDLTRPHIVTAAHGVPYSAMWVAFCTCGAEFIGTTADEVRDARRPHWEAEQTRLSRLSKGEGSGHKQAPAVRGPAAR